MCRGWRDAIGGGVGHLPYSIEGYDKMNVDEVSERLDNLFAEELRQVRGYEERNEGRETLLEQMDRKIRAS